MVEPKVPGGNGVLVVGYDAQHRISGMASNPRHRSWSWLKVWELAEVATALGSARLALVVRAPGRGSRPSAHEEQAFLNPEQNGRTCDLDL